MQFRRDQGWELALRWAVAGMAVILGGTTTVEAFCDSPLDAAVVSTLSGTDQITLSDGRHVRLRGIGPPHARPSAGKAENARTKAAAERLLQETVAGKEVTLFGDGTPDRRGRLVVQLVTTDGVWVQKRLVEEGLVRVMPLAGQTRCMDELIGFESAARRQGRGIWAHAEFAPRAASDTRALLNRLDRYEIVEGLVHSVGPTARGTYLNFGEDYRTDFTILITGAARKAFDDASIDLEALAGKPISVRGFVERRNGPLIQVDVVDQIHMLEPQ